MRPDDSQGDERRAAKYQNESLTKGLKILATVAESDTPLGAADISGLLEIEYSTAYRLLATLSELGYVERDGGTKKYVPGAGTLRLGASSIRNRSVHEVALPIMQDLAAEIGETVNLSLRTEKDMMVLASCESEQVLGSRYSRSRLYPIHCTASGKVMLAALDEGAYSDLLSALDLSAFTSRTAQSAERLRSELADVRRDGWALNDEEYVVGLISVAAPVRDRSSRTVAALDVSAPKARVSTADAVERLAPLVVDRAARISAELERSAATRHR